MIILFIFLFLFFATSFALIPGDFDGDNVADFEDLMIFAMHYRESSVHNLTKDTYYDTIQAALDVANSDNTIEVDDGTYNESITFPAGKLVTLQSASGIRDNVIIQGDNNLSTVTINGSSTDTTLSGFTITHTGGDTGRGINKSSGNLIIDNCIISGNTADYADYGGGIYNYEGTITITSSSNISGNTADYGAGISNSLGTINITSATISSNNVSQQGGGIYLGETGTITIGGSDSSDFDNFNTFNNNKKNGAILDEQHICDSSGDCRSSYPNNYYNPN